MKKVEFYIPGYYYLNFSDLNQDAKDRMIADAIFDIESTSCTEELEEEAKLLNISYDEFIREKAESHIYTYDFVFNV